MAIKCIKNHGKKVWLARIAYHGHRKARFCENREAAKTAEAELLQELMQQAEQEATDQAAPATLALVCDGYLLDLEARGKGRDTISTARNVQARLAEFFGARMQEPLALTGDDLFAYRAYRLQHWAKRGKKAKDGTTAILPGGTKASTINRDLRTIRAMLKKVLPDFRFPKNIFLPEDETRVKWLKPEDELLAFATVRAEAHIGPKRGTRPVPFRDMARLAAITMMRLSEIRTLRREQVDLSQGIVILPRTKTTPRHVVLSAEAQDILKRALDATKGEYLFPNPDGQPYSRSYTSRVWRAAARGAGLRDFHFHDLRHHGATMALNAGYTAPIVMALGGWKTERMMRRYAAVTDKTLRAAAEAISGGGGSGARQQPQSAFVGAA